MFRISCADLHLPEASWTKDASYLSANAWWEKKVAEIAAPAARQTAEIDALVDNIANHAVEEGINGNITKTLALLGEKIKDGLTLDRAMARVVAVAESVNIPKSGPAEFSLNTHTKLFIADERNRAESGDVKPETYGELQVWLLKVAEYLGDDLDVRTVNEITVQKLNNWLKKSSYAATTKRKVWRLFVRLVRYLWSMRLIELPRNLMEPKMQFKVRPKAVERFDTKLVKETVSKLKDRLRLYSLLALNCGMLGVDMASLRWKELDQDGWRIVRKRTKTGDVSDDVPTVSYKLWDETVKLLKANLSDHDTFVLTSSTNTVLWNSYIDEEGKRKKNDLITQQYARADSPIPLHKFRSIGATIIGDHEEYGRYYHHYLGHSPASMGDKHYVPPSEELFDKIMAYVGKTLGIK